MYSLEQLRDPISIAFGVSVSQEVTRTFPQVATKYLPSVTSGVARIGEDIGQQSTRKNLKWHEIIFKPTAGLQCTTN